MPTRLPSPSCSIRPRRPETAGVVPPHPTLPTVSRAYVDRVAPVADEPQTVVFDLATPPAGGRARFVVRLVDPDGGVEAVHAGDLDRDGAGLRRPDVDVFVAGRHPPTRVVLVVDDTEVGAVVVPPPEADGQEEEP